MPTIVVPTNKGFEATNSLHTSCQRLSAVSRGLARRYAPADSASPWTLASENRLQSAVSTASPSVRQKHGSAGGQGRHRGNVPKTYCLRLPTFRKYRTRADQ